MASKDIPIIFSAPMVRALLEGRKTMTRRILTATMPIAPRMDAIHPNNVARHAVPYFDAYCSERCSDINPRGMSRNWCWWTRDDRQCLPTISVKFQPGDRLWVRENHRLTDCDCREACRGAGNVWYDADESGYRNVASNKCRPSIHMPRWASRLTLIVTAVKVERLQDISNDDARAAGISWCDKFEWWHCDPNRDGAGPGNTGSPAKAFMNLWLMLHGEESVAENPFVVAISFRVIKANIDAPEARIAA